MNQSIGRWLATRCLRTRGNIVHCVVDFPADWINGDRFEVALLESYGPFSIGIYEVSFRFPTGCRIMVDCAIRILSLANQLVRSTRRVRMFFEEGDVGTMGYLNRMGFFDQLHPEVMISPERPVYSSALLHQGQNEKLVEIARINKDDRDVELPSRLVKVISRVCKNRADVKELSHSIWTIFCELIDNIFEHSATKLDGYAALQTYVEGNKLFVAVSDSGLGIMETLRPTLKSQFPQFEQKSDTELLVMIFRQGLSRHGEDRGCELKGCAAKAIKYNATLDVRLPSQRLVLRPARGAYEPNRAYRREQLPLMWGTHIGITFDLGVDSKGSSG